MSKQILLFTSEMIPGLSYPIAGGGIRAWQIGEGLRSKGHDVVYSIPQATVQGKDDLPVEIKSNAYHGIELDTVVEKVKPDIVVAIQWAHANKLNNLKVPLVLDLFGLLMLENAYFNEFNEEIFAISKIEAFSNADYFICASDKQKAYFFTWMMLAGINPSAECISAIPVSLSPDLPEPEIPSDPLMVFGGIFWPWQDPFTPLNEVIRKMDEMGKGTLKIYGSVHPHIHDMPLTYPNPEERLVKSPRVQRLPMLRHEELMNEYLKASFAVDLMMPNNERFLAYPIRTVCYLWSGLPVLISQFNDVSLLVKEYNAGWVVDPTHPGEIANTLERILKEIDRLPDYKTNAQRLVKERLTWDKTIEPLHRFCENPSILEKKDSLFKQVTQSLIKAHHELGKVGWENERLSKELDKANQLANFYKGDLDAIRSKLLYQIAHKIKQTLKWKK